MGLFRGGQPTIEEPFEGGEKKVAFKSIKYNSSLKQGTPALQKRFKGKVLILCQGASGINNYSHWLLDILPKIKIPARLAKDDL